MTSGVGRIALYEYGSFTFLGLTDTTGTGAKTISRTATAAAVALELPC
ncbi:MAG: hypothetical protein IPL28_26320 [Chloroflexi bacterium]|nr:hypothetical protein [Chloroflexota bacterium]